MSRVEKKVICEGCQENIYGAEYDTLYELNGRQLCKECFENEITQMDVDDLAEMMGVEMNSAEDLYYLEELEHGGGF